MDKGGRYALEIILAFVKNKKARVKATGEMINLLTLLIAISKCLAEKLSEEKRVDLEEAQNIVVDCLKDGMKTI